MRIAIIGAGPIGLEAALLATQLGHDVHVFEKGQVAENILDWGHVRLFSSFGINASEWGKTSLRNLFGPETLPRDDELLSGREFAERYLIPLSRLPELTGRIHEQTKVLSIGRRHFAKTTGIGLTERGNQPFRLLVEQHRISRSESEPPELTNYLASVRTMQPAAEPRHSVEPVESDSRSETIRGQMKHESWHIDERFELADAVLDCSGTYPHHNWLGDGGMPCIGERDGLHERHYRLPVIQAEEYGGRIVLVVGSGFSAATTVVTLAALSKWNPRTKTLWFANSQPGHGITAGPIARIPSDPLVERDRLAAKANELAVLGHISQASSPEVKDHPVVWFADAAIKSIAPTQTCHDVDGFQVELDWSRAMQLGTADPAPPPRVTVDRMIANVGYRPDRSIYEELHVHECYATQGPIKLAAKLLGETSSDCLAQTSHGADVLKNPEPNFFILGAKSYGRNSNFLLRVGIEQVQEVLSQLRITGLG